MRLVVEYRVARQLKIPDPSTIGLDTPLRLDVAAALAFPGGGITASGLRQEAFKGRLRLERIANKDFVTLRAIEDMRKQCAVSNHPTSSGENPGPPKAKPGSGSSSIEDGSIRTGKSESERREADLALADYITKTRQPNFGDGDPHQVLIGDCLAFYVEAKRIRDPSRWVEGRNRSARRILWRQGCGRRSPRSSARIT